MIDTGAANIASKMYASGASPPFTKEILEDAGWAAAVAFLDLINQNPISRIVNTSFKTVQTVREDVTRMFSNKIKVRRGWGVSEGPVKRSNTQLD